MKTAYLDCASGVSGDMTLGALIDAGAPLETIQAGIDSLGLPSCTLAVEEVKKKSFRATQLTVWHKPEQAHRHLQHITDMIEASKLSPPQQSLAKRIFTRLGKAEAKVHGTTIRNVHFHEVGAVDSIADIVGCAIGFDLLGVERVECSPVPTGQGFVEIAHGRCSIPAPATAELLAGVPLAASQIEAELTTPTGAAIVSTLAENFGPLPSMTIEKIGYGAGQRDLDSQANLLRILLGTTTAANTSLEQLTLLETNLDNTTGEQIGYCQVQLLKSGALDVFTSAITMKKSRPGVILSALCRPIDTEKLETIMFQETATLGIRRQSVSRKSLPRELHRVQTAWGEVKGKVATLPDGSKRFSAEYEDCRRMAQANGIALPVVSAAASDAFQATQRNF